MKKAFLIFLASGWLVASFGATLSYPIVDSNQTHAYDDRQAVEFPKAGERYFGQDGQYGARGPSYKDNGDGTVTDLVTGLMWTKTPIKATYQEALDGAETCVMGGYDDWRVPSIKEIYSLMQFNGLDPDPNSNLTEGLIPFIDRSVFDFEYGDPREGERVIDSQFVTTSVNVSPIMTGQESFFGLNLADGRIKAYPTQSRREKKFRALYTRGNVAYGKNEFRDHGDGTITDAATGLMWMKADSVEGMDWPTALGYAEQMEFAGHSDWRLPSAKELQSIIDYTRSPGKTDSAAIDPIFDATPIKNEGGNKDFAHYWTSTTHLKSRGSQNGAVYFAFGRSLGWMQNRRTGEMTLMDVHGAGSQRADPKVGDASRFPQGRGPQGDVVRIQNMVRLVRGGEVALLESGPPLESSAQRQSSSRGARGGGENRFLNRFDSNGDRSISRDEFTGRPERFRTLDTNGDGVIDESEAANARPPEGQGGQGGRNGQGRGRPQAQRQGPAEVGQGANRLLSRFDSNEDGQVTREEFTGAEERFRELDTDENGLIDETEIQNARPPQDRENVMGSLASDEAARESDATKPNFVFIFADDLGWTGTSVEMIPGDSRTKSDFYQTPHIEKLAARGMRFSANYAPAAVCTPSRAAVLTGKTPAQLHITSPGAGLSNNSHKLKSPTQLRSLPESETTIAEVLSRVGYRSAYFGKWHLGSGNPGQHGFHTHDGSTANATPANEPNSNPKDIFGLNDRAIAFMKENVDTGTPFYVQLFHYAVHAPLATRAESEAKFGKEPSGKNHQNATYAAMTWDFDQSIGLLMDEIDKMGIADNTYIVFTSDNGAAGGPRVRLNNSPLSKGKSTLYEGGLRVPMIVVGPGIEENSHSAVRVTGCDLFPTFCEWAGIDDLEPVDGTSLASLLAGETNKLDRHVSSLLFHSPHYGRGPDSMPASSIIAGDYKLIRFWDGMNHLLFNLAEDLGEQKDLSKKEPGRLEEMTAMLDARLSSVGAQLLTKNMDYDPNAAVEERARGAGRRTQQGGGGQNRRL